MTNPYLHPAAARPADADMHLRLEAAARLLKLFQMERYAYLAATLLAVGFLLATAVILVQKESYALAFGMFGSSGVITVTIGRLLRLWNQVFKAILGGGGHGDD